MDGRQTCKNASPIKYQLKGASWRELSCDDRLGTSDEAGADRVCNGWVVHVGSSGRVGSRFAASAASAAAAAARSDLRNQA